MTLRSILNPTQNFFSKYAVTAVMTCCAVSVLSLFSMTAMADITVEAFDAGFVTEMGGSAKGDGTIVPPATYNYSVGQELHYSDGSLGIPPGSTPLAYMDRNNYFVFDLSAISEPIVGATLMLPAGIFESVDPTETFHLVAPIDPGIAIFDADSLLVGNGMGPGEFDEPTDPLVSVAAALYGNIEAGSGDILGTKIISSGDDLTTIAIELDPAGIDYLNAFAGGILFLGGDVSTITPGMTTQQPFGSTGLEFPELVLTTIPEPNAVWMLLPTLGLMAMRIRRPRSASR